MGKETLTNNDSKNNVVVISSRHIKELVSGAFNDYYEDISLLKHYDIISVFTKRCDIDLSNDKNILDANANIGVVLDKFDMNFSEDQHKKLVENPESEYLNLLKLIIEKTIESKASYFEKDMNAYDDLLNVKRIKDSNIFIYFNWFKEFNDNDERKKYLYAIMQTIKDNLEQGNFTYYYLLHDKDIIKLASNLYSSSAYQSFEELKVDNDIENASDFKYFLNIQDEYQDLFLRLYKQEKTDDAYSFLTETLTNIKFNNAQEHQEKIIAFIKEECEVSKSIKDLYDGYGKNGTYNFDNVDLHRRRI